MNKFPVAITIVSFFGLWLVLWLPFAILSAVKLDWRPFQPSSPAQKLPLLAVLYLLAPLILVGLTRVGTVATEGYPFAIDEVPQISPLTSVLGGLAGGSCGLLLFFWIQQRVGWLQWRMPKRSLAAAAPDHLSPEHLSPEHLSLDWMIQPALVLLLSLWIGWTEELVFRGFLQTQLERELSVWGAAAVGSLIFALLHSVWEGRSIVPQLPGLWLMGMVLVWARQIEGGSLGVAWGLHAGWVWVMASLDTLQLIDYTGKTSVWITGLDAKPLAGLMGLLFLGLTALGLFGIRGWM